MSRITAVVVAAVAVAMVATVAVVAAAMVAMVTAVADAAAMTRMMTSAVVVAVAVATNLVSRQYHLNLAIFFKPSVDELFWKPV